VVASKRYPLIENDEREEEREKWRTKAALAPLFYVQHYHCRPTPENITKSSSA